MKLYSLILLALFCVPFFRLTDPDVQALLAESIGTGKKYDMSGKVER